MFSSSSQKLVLVIGCDSTGEEQFFTNESAFTAWCQRELDLGMVGRVQPLLLQTAIRGPELVPSLVRHIKKNWKHVQGAVCILPAEQFLQTAAALAFALGHVGQPVVCITHVGTVGRKDPNMFDQDGVRLHIMNAVQISISELSGVVVSSGSEVMPATHAIIAGHHPRLMSADRVVYAHVDFGIRITHHTKPRHNKPLVTNLLASSHIERHIQRINAQHSESIEDAFSRVTPKTVGVLVTNATRDMRPRIAAAAALHKTVPVLVVEADHALLYQKGQWTLLDWLTADTAVVKFLWILAQRKAAVVPRRGSLLTALRTDIVGESLV